MMTLVDDHQARSREPRRFIVTYPRVESLNECDDYRRLRIIGLGRSPLAAPEADDAQFDRFLALHGPNMAERLYSLLGKFFGLRNP